MKSLDCVCLLLKSKNWIETCGVIAVIMALLSEYILSILPSRVRLLRHSESAR